MYVCVRVRVCVWVHVCVCCVVLTSMSAKGYLNFGMPRHPSTVVCIQRLALHCSGEVLPPLMGGRVRVQGEVRSSPSHIHLRLAQLQSCRALASQLFGGSHAKSTCPTVHVKIFFIPSPGISVCCTVILISDGSHFCTN